MRFKEHKRVSSHSRSTTTLYFLRKWPIFALLGGSGYTYSSKQVDIVLKRRNVFRLVDCVNPDVGHKCCNMYMSVLVLSPELHLDASWWYTMYTYFQCCAIIATRRCKKRSKNIIKKNIVKSAQNAPLLINVICKFLILYHHFSPFLGFN